MMIYEKSLELPTQYLISRYLVEFRELVVVATVRQPVGDTVDSRKDTRTAYDAVTFPEMKLRFIHVLVASAAAA